MKKPIYLDYAAATPVSNKVKLAMEPFLAEAFYNPSAIYSGARDAKAALEQARAVAAQSIGCRPSEIIFTSGGTESANLAINGAADQHKDKNIIISTIEHDAVRKPAILRGAQQCPVDERGVLNVGRLETMIDEDTVLISCMYANNEIGTVQPIKQIVELVAGIRRDRRASGNKTPLYVHTDACQAPQYLDVNVARLGVDLMTLNGGKMHGPKQSGVLFVKAGVILTPQILGGGQENGMRSGTESVASCVGLAVALKAAVSGRTSRAKSQSKLSDYFMNELKKRFDAVINGHLKRRLPNNIHVTFSGKDNERILFSLDDHGVYAAAGSACSASSEESSHVLTAIGVSEDDARASVRFSIGSKTTQDEIDQALLALEIALSA